MKELTVIKKKINDLRLEINIKIAEGKSLDGKEILTLSQKLDSLINQWYKIERCTKI